jgi:hypothetical protein
MYFTPHLTGRGAVMRNLQHLAETSSVRASVFSLIDIDGGAVHGIELSFARGAGSRGEEEKSNKRIR